MTTQSPLYISVVVPLPVRGTFTYRVPDSARQSAEAGRRALVPFGKRILTGFITGVSGDPGDVPLTRMKSAADIIDDEPVFDSHMLRLAEWVADYYLCSTGEVLRAAMPTGTMVQSRLRIHFVTDENADDLPVLHADIIDRVREHGSILLKTLERSIGTPVSAIVRSLEARGYIRTEQEIETPRVRPKTERHVLPDGQRPAELAPKARQQAKCLDIIDQHPDGMPLAELLERYSISRGVVAALVRHGYAKYVEVERTRKSGILAQEAIEADHPLTPDQQACHSMIESEAARETPRPVLIRGVTGSGKTRVYIEAVRRALEQGRGAILLVPEIALTPQTTRFFTSVFGDRVAVMHSAMSIGERYDMWRMIRDGRCDVVIGPRSAVFAPLQNPGVIIVDEEHDASYKQSETPPRYHGRDVAVMRAHLLGIPVVLGSATPSLESWQNTADGKYRLATLERRVRELALPEVLIVDMKSEHAEGNLSSISRTLRERLAETAERGEKSIILINRRGFATGIQCRSCGHVLLCPHCSVGLTYHASKELGVCHLCGHTELVLEHCPECGETDLKFRGRGTQRIEREIAALLGEDTLIRMDSDTTRSHDAHYRLLEEFRRGNRPVLLGTQMVAKGLDFPDVTLVGIISADSALGVPDFRAGERTFQLITQVAGRAGRGDRPGSVVLQTYNPENYAILNASRHDFPSFADAELRLRRDVGFPPFSRLLLLEISSTDNDEALSIADTIAAFLVEHTDDTTEVMGPVEAPIPVIRKRHRHHILVKSTSGGTARRLVRHVLDTLSSGKVQVTVDVDPINLM